MHSQPLWLRGPGGRARSWEVLGAWPGPSLFYPPPPRPSSHTRLFIPSIQHTLINHHFVPSTMPHDLQKLPLCFHDLHLQTQGPLHKQSFSAQLLLLWLLLLLIVAVTNTAETQLLTWKRKKERDF